MTHQPSSKSDSEKLAAIAELWKFVQEPFDSTGYEQLTQCGLNEVEKVCEGIEAKGLKFKLDFIKVELYRNGWAVMGVYVYQEKTEPDSENE